MARSVLVLSTILVLARHSVALSPLPMHMPGHSMGNFFQSPTMGQSMRMCSCPCPPAPHYRVVGVLTPGLFEMDKSTGTYGGFMVDLLDELASYVGFTYTIMPQPDGLYGVMGNDGAWSGLISSLMNDFADIAAADQIVTSARESVVDFLPPFYEADYRFLSRNGTDMNTTNFLVIADTSEIAELQASVDPFLRRVWQNILAKMPESIVDSYEAAMVKVRAGTHALFYNTPALLLDAIKSNGSLVMSGDSYGSSYLAFAVQQGSPLRETLATAMLALKESGRLDELLIEYGLLEVIG